MIIFFSNTDILIVSDIDIALNPLEIDNILQFIRNGKSVYLQTEYLPNFVANQAFESIIRSLGGTFKWGNLFKGDLKMNVLGEYANTIDTVNSISCWYSVSGKGDCNTINILENGGEFHGWQYIPQDHSYGSIISIADQDWIIGGDNLPFMENLLSHLITPPIIPNSNHLDLGADTTLCKGDSLVLDASSINGSYLWNDSSTLPTYILKGQGKYWVLATLDWCTMSDSITIHIKQCDCSVYDPNVFSVKSSNGNSRFSIQSNCQFSEFHLSIYDRWGELVFKSEDEMEPWDGTFRGYLSPMGGYTFLLEYKFMDDSPVQYYGNITLIR
jgi:gliding motility-associated-like protein